MELVISPLNDSAQLVKLTGRLDAKGITEIDQDLTVNLVAAGKSAIIDLSDVTFLASIGMRLLISAARGVSAKNKQLVLLSPQPLVREALVTAGFDALIPIHDDLESASLALSAA